MKSTLISRFEWHQIDAAIRMYDVWWIEITQRGVEINIVRIIMWYNNVNLFTRTVDIYKEMVSVLSSIIRFVMV